MKARKYTEEQIIAVLREGKAGAKVAFFDTSVLSFKLYRHFRVVDHYTFSMGLCCDAFSNGSCPFIFY